MLDFIPGFYLEDVSSQEVFSKIIKSLLEAKLPRLRTYPNKQLPAGQWWLFAFKTSTREVEADGSFLVQGQPDLQNEFWDS